MKLILRHIDYIATGGLIVVTLITGAILASNTTIADDPVSSTSSANASVNVASACSMTALNTSAHTISMVNSTTEENVGITTLTATCNDAGGLAIYAVGYSGDEYGNTNMIGTTGNIATGTSDSTSNWSMRLYTATGSVTPSSITNTFTAVPSTYTKFAELNSGTTGSSALAVNATYRFHISATQPADTYTGKVKYTMVHPSTEVPPAPQTTQSGQICYYPNGTNVVGSMGCQTITSSATSATLLASNFSREGYGFAGWSTTFDYSDSTGFYGPQEYITFDAGTYTGSNPGLSLYARWIKSAGNLQNWSGCSSLASGAVTALTDQRDNDTYAVAKLADGNCWMIENLRLDNTNSDNSTGALSQGYASGFVGLADSESPWAYDSTTANSLYSTDGSTSVTISGSNPYNRMPRYNNVNTPSSASDRPQNPTANDATNNTSNAGMYSYGNYYTWTAASTDTSTTSAGDYNTKSICPTGWSIPRGGNKSREATNDFWTYIVTNLNGGTNPANYDSSTTQPNYTGSTEGTPVSNALRSYPNNFVYSGYIGSSSVGGRGSYGNFWSSTASDSGYAYNLYLYNSNVYPGTFNTSKSAGRSVRCIIPGA